MEGDPEARYLKQRVEELEDRIEQLRLSRRVLMNLVEKTEREKTGFLSRLEKENRRLSQNNCRYARSLIRKNRRILELESRLQNTSPRESANP
ncbi:MAG: translation initiation factor 2 [Peptococcaceae bacterium]|nr:translation initiation factor 2 [Peptococcaceae bacterium]